jgi:ubiquinone/menaquinone biosynthesis C-methylase UbiE
MSPMDRQSSTTPKPELPTTPGQVFAHFRQLPEMQQLVRDCYYDDVADAANRFYASAEFAEVKEQAAAYGQQPPGLVLEIGGGNGMASVAWERSGFQTILLEPDADKIVGYGALIPLINQGKTKTKVCASFGEYLPFASNSFDIVYVRQVLHHIHDLDSFHKEVYRVLKPGGLYIATREHVISKLSDLDTFLAAHVVHQYTHGENAYLLDDYVGAIQHAGFNQIKVLSRWKSIINYYPMTKPQVRSLVAQRLRKYTGKQLAHYLSLLEPIYDAGTTYLSKRDNYPGRMYSFFATKAKH